MSVFPLSPRPVSWRICLSSFLYGFRGLTSLLNQFVFSLKYSNSIEWISAPLLHEAIEKEGILVACVQTSHLPQKKIFSFPDFFWGRGNVCTQVSILNTFSNHNSLDQPPFPKQRGYQARVTQGTPFCHDRTITGKHQPRVGAFLIRTQARFCTFLRSLDFRTSVRFSLWKKPRKSERVLKPLYTYNYFYDLVS